MKGKKLNTNIFITRASNIHKNKYDYSKTIYTLSCNKVVIICPIHGEFLQKAQSHLAGKGCKKCAMEILKNSQRLTKEDFIRKSNKIHNFKYDYSLVNYINNNTKVKIICSEHGIFEQTPRGHLTYNCPKCHLRGYSKENWIKIANKNQSSILYIIKCFNKNEEFIKIGITSKTIKERFKFKELPYNYEILTTYEYPPEIIWEFEKELHKDYLKDYQYIPKIKFNGMYECFSMWVIEPLYPRIFGE